MFSRIKIIPIASRQGSWVLLGLSLLWQPVRVVLAEGEVYTWKDAAGRVHYGSHPPEGQAAQPVLLNASPVSVQPTERIYTWTDTEGAVHYGARPPSDTEIRELKEEDGSLSTIRSSKLRPGEQQLLRELPDRE
ncbi:MAG: DUF4124 domain-containing protein [Candidatus Competibacter sp.]|nr:DUF4124 domain-containing protein [Candidatus Competibacter sp.]MDG4584899.1 DUF4124 domain-containing protein [Candidatus Competibacter sp.]